MKNSINLCSLALMLTLLLFGCSKAETESSAQTLQRASNTNNDFALNAVTTIDNNSFWYDTNGQIIQAQGGNILKDGSTYHWFGMEFARHPTCDPDASERPIKWVSVNHYSSTDLKNWTRQTAAVTPTTSGSPLAACDWVGRPFVMKNPNNNNYVLVLERGGSGVSRNRYYFYTSTSINGPWTNQPTKTILNLPDKTGATRKLGDLGVFVDGNVAYLMYTFDHPQTNYSRAILKLDADFMTPLSSTNAANYEEFTGNDQSWNQNEVREAAAIFKRGSIYYYFTSKCTGWPSSETRYKTSTTVTSASNDWSPATSSSVVLTNPISTNSFNTQHDFVLPIVGSTTTTYMYCGDRWNNMNTGIGGIGTYQWFPISFDNSAIPVPTINAPDYGGTGNGGDWSIDLVTGVWTPDTAGVNVLANPGFDSDITNWTTTGNASIATLTAEVHSGAKALKTYSSSAYTTTAQSSVSTSYPAGTYTARVWGRGSGTYSQRIFQVFINGTPVNLTMPTGTTWTQHTISNITIPAGASVKVGISLNAGAGAWSQFDDFELVKN